MEEKVETTEPFRGMMAERLPDAKSCVSQSTAASECAAASA
jgi:hypothetical protein